MSNEKITKVRVRYTNNEFSQQYPIGTTTSNVYWNESDNDITTLTQILGQIDLENKGPLQKQIDDLENDKAQQTDLTSLSDTVNANKDSTDNEITAIKQNINDVNTSITNLNNKVDKIKIVDVDSKFSADSTNPVQNKIIKAKIDELQEGIEEAKNSFDLSDRLKKGTNGQDETVGTVIEGDIDYNIASGNYSHVEGANNVSRYDYQHVSGKYNDPGDKNHQYAEIVGNGKSEEARSNARTLDWQGNEILAGKLTLGVSPTDSDLKDAATVEYVQSKINGTGLTVDDEVTQNGSNAVKGSGIYDFVTTHIPDVGDLQDDIDTLQAQIGTLNTSVGVIRENDTTQNTVITNLNTTINGNGTQENSGLVNQVSNLLTEISNLKRVAKRIIKVPEQFTDHVTVNGTDVPVSCVFNGGDLILYRFGNVVTCEITCTGTLKAGNNPYVPNYGQSSNPQAVRRRSIHFPNPYDKEINNNNTYNETHYWYIPYGYTLSQGSGFATTADVSNNVITTGSGDLTQVSRWHIKRVEKSSSSQTKEYYPFNIIELISNNNEQRERHCSMSWTTADPWPDEDTI